VTSTSQYAGRSTRRYKALRAEFRRKCRNASAPCWLCGKAIDYDLPPDHPDCFNVDHAIAKSKRPDLAEDMANFRPSHKVCNERRGNDAPNIDIGRPSEDW
jgi:hypothetical protein